jgi:hypothetical protein
MFPVHDHGADGFDGYLHDPRCMGDCGPCGGVGGVPDTGPNGEMAMTCLSCGASGRCQGCNLYAPATREDTD